MTNELKFNDVYKKYNDYFRKVGFKIIRVPGEDIHEELHQNFWMVIARRLHEYDETKGTKLKTWLIIIWKGEVSRLFKMNNAKIQRDNEIGFDDVIRSTDDGEIDFEAPDDLYEKEQSELRDLIDKILNEMPEEEKQLMTKYFEGKTQTAIAKESGLKRGTFGMRFQRAKRLFKGLYRHEMVYSSD